MWVKPDLLRMRISGMGGQGILLAGYIIGRAAVEYDGILAVQSESYGPEMRGTKCKTDILLSYNNAPIYCPALESADILVVMSQDAWMAYNHILHADSLVFFDVNLVQHPQTAAKTYPIPSTKFADELGNRIVANIVMLGALIGTTHIVTKSAIEWALELSVPTPLAELNINALRKGYEMANALTS